MGYGFHSSLSSVDWVLRAGMKNAKGLLHLREHLPDGPRLKLAGATKRRDDEPVPGMR